MGWYARRESWEEEGRGGKVDSEIEDRFEGSVGSSRIMFRGCGRNKRGETARVRFLPRRVQTSQFAPLRLTIISNIPKRSRHLWITAIITTCGP